MSQLGGHVRILSPVQPVLWVWGGYSNVNRNCKSCLLHLSWLCGSALDFDGVDCTAFAAQAAASIADALAYMCGQGWVHKGRRYCFPVCSSLLQFKM
jgi:hypothetical protein